MTTLYQEMIIDHGRHPRNFGELADADCQHEGFNPLCGDQLTLYVKLRDDRVAEVLFKGQGCAISMASASLMTEMIKGKTHAEIKQIAQHFHDLLMDKNAPDYDLLGKLTVLEGVKAYPMRVKCATLAWHTLQAALAGDKTTSTTE